MHHPQTKRFFVLLLLLSVAVIILSLATGTTPVRLDSLWEILRGQQSGIQAQIITELRWPRTATAFLTGGLLGMSGVLMQVMLRNPLADPYILGISGGAATGALIAISIGIAGNWVDIAAFSGAMLSMLLVYLLSHSASASRNHGNTLLLTGVVLAAGWGAMINLLLIMADAQTIHSMLFWLMGDLRGASLPSPVPLIVLLLSLTISWFLARDLNLLSQGEHKAQLLGSPVGLVRKISFLLAVVCTAIAVSMAGSVGFVGLIIPHLMRLVVGNNHRLVLPASVHAGGALLTLADLGARTVIAPQQLPVGVITALIGVPVFLFLLKHRHQ